MARRASLYELALRAASTKAVSTCAGETSDPLSSPPTASRMSRAPRCGRGCAHLQTDGDCSRMAAIGDSSVVRHAGTDAAPAATRTTSVEDVAHGTHPQPATPR